MNKKNLLIGTTAIVLLLAVVGHLVMSVLCLECSLWMQIAVPAFFWIFYSTAILVVENPADTSAFAKMMLGFKAAKMFFSLVAVTAIAFVLRKNAIAVLIYFFAFSSILLVAESFYLIRLKKKYRQ